jgi:hypothetical protein
MLSAVAMTANVTGFDLLQAETAGKRLKLLLDLVPRARSIAYLYNPTNPVFAESEMREVQVAAQALGVRLLLVNASTPIEIDTAFADLVKQRADALQVSADGFLLTHPDQIVALAARNAVPAIYAWRQAMAVGGLVSYGTNILDAWRQAGIYTGRLLKGEKPADLPVQEVTKIELIINLKTAKALSLEMPTSLLLRAEEAPRIHHASRRRGGVAACGARAAAGDAGGRLHQRRGGRCVSKPSGRIPQGAQRSWLCRGSECHGRIPPGWRAIMNACQRCWPIWFGVAWL